MLNNTKITSIVAVDPNYGIGYQNNILFHNKADMAHFRTVTKTIGVCIMGRKTYESLLPNLLKDRICIVLSTNKPALREDPSIWVKGIDELQSYLNLHNIPAACVIGGSEIYELLIPSIDEWYITHFKVAATNVDTFLSYTTIANLSILEENATVLFTDQDMVIKLYLTN